MANNEYTENDALRLLAEKTEGSRIENDTMIIPDEGLAVSIKLVKCQEHNGNFSSQVIFFIKHELFDQPLVESCAGIGKSADEAVGRAVENFCASVMLSVRSVLNVTVMNIYQQLLWARSISSMFRALRELWEWADSSLEIPISGDLSRTLSLHISDARGPTG